MKKLQVNITIIIFLVLFSLSCSAAQRFLLGIGGLQGQVDSLTNVANPIENEESTLNPTSLLTPENSSQENPAETKPISTVSPTPANSPQANSSPTDDAALQIIYGQWSGTAQWFCDNQPIWSMTLDLQPNEVVTATLTIPGQTNHQDGTWVLSGDDINLYFEHGFMIGTVSGNSMEGTFSEENCTGAWSVSKEK